MPIFTNCTLPGIGGDTACPPEQSLRFYDDAGITFSDGAGVKVDAVVMILLCLLIISEQEN